MAHVFILTSGSRGDVQPYLALGLALRASGHTVTLMAPRNFAAWLSRHDLNFAPLSADFLEMAQTPEGKKALAGGNSLTLMQKMMPLLRAMLAETVPAAQGAQVVVYHPKALAGPHLAQALGVPGVLALPLPLLTPTTAFPAPLLTANLGGTLNRLSYTLLNALTILPYRALVNQWRRESLNLPPGDGAPPALTLYPISPQVLPHPADWPANVHLTGYWFLNEGQNWQPPADLHAFLQAGPPPVYVGFGSMTSAHPDRLAQAVLEAAQTLAVRVVLATGWNTWPQGGRWPESVFRLEAAPHDALFPLMRAVVHHGGAGTTAAALRAGRPQVIVPFFGDQPFWGQRMQALSVAAAPVPQAQITGARLTAALRPALTDPALTQRATALGTAVNAEDGLAEAVRLLTPLL